MTGVATASRPVRPMRRGPSLSEVLSGLEHGAGSHWCQRWTFRQLSWRVAGEAGFDPDRYVVEEIPDWDAALFVGEHHHSMEFPAALHCYGLIRREDRHLLGVAVVGAPPQTAVLTRAFPTLEPYRESGELSRLVLVDQAEGDAELLLLGGALQLARAAGLRGLVSYADAQSRRTRQGEVIVHGHIGAVYREATGVVYLGQGPSHVRLLMPDGSLLEDGAAGRFGAQRPGSAYLESRLIAAGARPRRCAEDPVSWLTGALRQAGVRRVRHESPHRYLFALGNDDECGQLLPAERAGWGPRRSGP